MEVVLGVGISRPRYSILSLEKLNYKAANKDTLGSIDIVRQG